MQLSKQMRRSYRDIFWPVLLIAVLVACFAFTAYFLRSMAMRECYHEVELAADDAASTLQHNFALYQANLELIASLLTVSPAPDRAALQTSLDMYCRHQQVDALCVQFADGSVVFGGSAAPDYSQLPPFEQMQKSAPYISGRFPGAQDSGTWFLYLAVPISDGGQVTAILYGLMDLSQLPALFEANIPYDGQGQLCLIDGSTGDYLMDMQHDTLGNLFDGSLGARQAKPGYDAQTAIDDMRSGRSGYFVFLSQASGEYLYTRYQPAGVSNWSIHLTVPESVAFAHARHVICIIVFLGSIVLTITAAYIFFAFALHRRSLRQKQLQIRQATFMFDVQQILFDAHQNPALMVDALRLVANTLDAEGVLLFSLRSSQVHRMTAWRRPDAVFQDIMSGESLQDNFPDAFGQLTQGRSVLFYEDEKVSRLSPAARERIRSRQVRSMMLTPVRDAEGVLRGVLCAVNLGKRWDSCSYLECVAHSFMMAMNNMESYQIIHDMGTTDILTGMKNRNSYEADLPGYAQLAHGALCCIYIDVNGLHELNNQRGHKAGDAMLCFIADQIHAFFGPEHSYRIGGDEFVIFSADHDPSVLAQRLKDLRQAAESRQYYISVGLSCSQECGCEIEATLAQAEAAMYREKRAFYQKHDRRGRQR